LFQSRCGKKISISSKEKEEGKKETLSKQKFFLYFIKIKLSPIENEVKMCGSRSVQMADKNYILILN
jgi:hypothetical protein